MTQGYKIIICPICGKNNYMRPQHKNPDRYFRRTGCFHMTDAQLHELIGAGSMLNQQPIRQRIKAEWDAERANDPPPANEVCRKEILAALGAAEAAVRNMNPAHRGVMTGILAPLNGAVLAALEKIR